MLRSCLKFLAEPRCFRMPMELALISLARHRFARNAICAGSTEPNVDIYGDGKMSWTRKQISLLLCIAGIACRPILGQEDPHQQLHQMAVLQQHEQSAEVIKGVPLLLCSNQPTSAAISGYESALGFWKRKHTDQSLPVGWTHLFLGQAYSRARRIDDFDIISDTVGSQNAK